MSSFKPFDLARFLTPRGFTGHEHLDNVGLIHMNGRVYDPEIARFISADPIIQAPMYLQDYNRYTYAWNNPLSVTDPSGFIDDYSNSQPDSSWNGGSGSSSSRSSGSSGDGGSSDVSSYGYPSGVKWDPGSVSNGDTFASDDRDSGHDTTVTTSGNDAAARAEQARKDAAAAQLREQARRQAASLEAAARQQAAQQNAIMAQNVVNTLSTISNYASYAATVSLFAGVAGVSAAGFFTMVGLVTGALATAIDMRWTEKTNETAAAGTFLTAGYKFVGDKLPGMLPGSARMTVRIAVDLTSQVHGGVMNEAARNEERDSNL